MPAHLCTPCEVTTQARWPARTRTVGITYKSKVHVQTMKRSMQLNDLTLRVARSKKKLRPRSHNLDINSNTKTALTTCSAMRNALFSLINEPSSWQDLARGCQWAQRGRQPPNALPTTLASQNAHDDRSGTFPDIGMLLQCCPPCAAPSQYGELPRSLDRIRMHIEAFSWGVANTSHSVLTCNGSGKGNMSHNRGQLIGIFAPICLQLGCAWKESSWPLACGPCYYHQVPDA